MKFKDYRLYYLSEGRTTDIDYQSEEEIVYTIHQKCSEFMKDANRIALYRGKPQSTPFAYLDPKKHTRESKGLNNLYHKIIDEHPIWSKYPSRSHSIIVSGEYDIAENYGSVHLVFPINGAEWGVCEESDFWYSFRKPLGGFTLADMEGWFYSFSTLYLKKDLPKFKNLSEIENHCKEMEKFVDAQRGQSLKDILYQDAMGFIESYVNDKTKIYDTLVSILSPEAADVKLCDNKTLKKYIHDVYDDLGVGAECWTESPCYILAYDLFQNSDYLTDSLDLPSL
jgi:hypothetical protein